ncbi:hypothetical protein PS627_01531 [Pseudomonas fluorescens]|uniref:class I SAM-dependent methyltransferase n=1 Tax=Pseudomonas fluorescens TaxID=294 RepID=UPI0012583CA7|nr:class I SAM-dependent methyltransferase [Pseudomonas fluorescens]CAG8865612.1 hypothetical protein PS627_01531 [Pseudomonas fluorescens]
MAITTSKTLKPLNADVQDTAMFQLAEQFDQLAKGTRQVPKAPVDSHLKHLIQDKSIIEYHDLLIRESGPLFKHFLASVPYILEELCRIGVAISRYVASSENTGDPQFNFLDADAFDGSNARALASLSRGLINTLTTSPNQSNQRFFDEFRNPEFSSFFPRSILELTPAMLQNGSYKKFSTGFDFIYEMAAFQFYGNDRPHQITHIKKLLKSGGIVFFLEKLNHNDTEEYFHRERLKDNDFKHRYFTKEEILWKQNQMLEHMQSGQVVLSDLAQKIKENFRYAYLIWNSTNFYEIIASDDHTKIQSLMRKLGPTIQPDGFCFEQKKIGPL